MSLTVRLNGSNYVSDKTRAAFEQALAGDHKIQVAGNGHNNGDSQAHAPSLSAGAWMPAAEAVAVTGQAPVTAHMPAAEQGQPSSNQAPDYARLFESLERGLAQSYEHQAQTLRIHEQYLSYQSNYAALYTQLLQQQGAIFTAGHADPQQAALAAQVLESLSHSLACFHDLQTETLNVHKQFLSQQAEYSQARVEILRQQQPLTSGGGHVAGPGKGNGVDQSKVVHTAIHHLHQGEIRRARDNGHNGHDGKGNGRIHGDHAILTSAPAAARPAEVAPAPTKPSLSLAQASAPTIWPAELPAQPAVTQAKSEEGIVQTPLPPASSSKFSRPDTAALTESLLTIVSEKTGYPADMLDLSMDMEADLGIDSIKRVEILGALQERHPDLPKIEPQALAELRTLGQIVEHVRPTLGTPAPIPAERSSEPIPASALAPQNSALAPADVSSGPGMGTLTESLLTIVSEKTGYPTDMLDLTMDMEADLGIDSIKRVEILGALQERHPDLPKIEPQALAELRTLGQIVNYLQTGPDPKKA